MGQTLSLLRAITGKGSATRDYYLDSGEDHELPLNKGDCTRSTLLQSVGVNKLRSKTMLDSVSVRISGCCCQAIRVSRVKRATIRGRLAVQPLFVA